MTTTPAGPAVEDIARAAAEVLRRNDAGTMTRAAPGLYPHMWSWDSAFIAIGLARFDVPRAIRELQTLLDAQWSTGMIPHIVFNPDEPGYFPDFARWGTERAAARPAGVQTSGICQPPVHAIAVRHILDRGRERGGADEAAAEEFARGSLDAWAAWHHWLASVRDPDRSGLVEIHHSWESGFDNSPRWDAAYARIHPGDVPPFQRRDTLHVADASERPTNEEYTRYLWLVEQLKSVDYDDAAALDVVDFRVKDVFFSAVLAVASDVLADLADELGRTDLVPGLRDIADRFRLGVRSTIDPATELARDFDVRAGEWIGTETIAGFAPLFAGTSAEIASGQTGLLRGERWMGDPRLRFPLPPSTSPASPAFRPSTYWRGPTWPFLTLLLGWAVDRHGDPELAAELRTASLAQLADLAFGEYYQPFTGEPLGSHDQSWTAAAALEWAGQLGVAAG